MAFKKANLKSGNPTGDKNFNQLTKLAFKPSMTEPDADDAGDQGQPPAKKPMPKGGRKYDTGTNTYRSC